MLALTSSVREFIATTVMHWLRDPNAVGTMIDWTPRTIRDVMLGMIPPDDTSPMERRRIANELARWIQDEDGYVAVRYESDLRGLAAISRVIDGALEKKGAEKDEDIVSDETAWSYPRLSEWIGMVAADMRGLAREQRRLGIRPKKAFETLVRHAHGSILDVMGAQS